MNPILLADDSPHAQRMGERIFRDEGYDVVSVTDGDAAMLRLADVNPDLVVADVFLPGRSGFDICRAVKNSEKHRHVRVVLTAGLLETFDEQEARAAGADAIIRKPFESSVVLETIKPLIEGAAHARAQVSAASAPEPPAAMPAPNPEPEPASPPVVRAASHSLEIEPGAAVTEEELLRAAITVALDSAFPALVDDITTQVLRNLRAGTATYEPAPDSVPVPVAPLPDSVKTE